MSGMARRGKPTEVPVPQQEHFPWAGKSSSLANSIFPLQIIFQIKFQMDNSWNNGTLSLEEEVIVVTLHQWQVSATASEGDYYTHSVIFYYFYRCEV